MASSLSSSLLLPLGSASTKSICVNHQSVCCTKIRGLVPRCSSLQSGIRISRTKGSDNSFDLMKRRDVMGLVFVASTLFVDSYGAKGAGLPPEEKPRLCDASCEKELENVPMVTTESGLQYKDIIVGSGPSPPVGFQVAANYVAMVPSGQIFDSSLDKGLPYLFRVGSGQVIKGLDEGIMSMKVGGKRRLYIPGPLAFPKGLNSAPGRPRVAPSSPVVFDVSLEYVPGLETEEE
uniref:peptidylprolyl isomerase n=1 Tax=California macrophylla TaxID=337344 RepID=A0A0F7GYY7_9ROSI